MGAAKTNFLNMGFLDFFRKKDDQTIFRRKVRSGFKRSVKEAKKHLTGNSMIDGMLIKQAIANYRIAILNAPTLQMIGLFAKDWMPETIIDEETQRVLKKYFGYSEFESN